MDYKVAYEKEREQRILAEKSLDEKSKEVQSSLKLIRHQYASIASQKRGLELLLNMAQMAELRLERETVLKVFVDAVGTLLDASYGIVFLRNKISETESVIRASAISFLPEDEYPDVVLKQLSGERLFSSESAIGKKVVDGVNVFEVKKTMPELYHKNMTGWLVYFPIRKNGNLEAVAEFGLKSWSKESESHMAQAMASASQIGVMLERSDAHLKLEKNFRQIKEAHDQLKSAQSQLVHSEKMASIGQLAAGVAHEINNPVGFVMSNIDTLQEYLCAFMEIYQRYEDLSQVISIDNDVANDIINKIQKAKKKHDFGFIIEDIDQVIQDSSNGLGRVKEIVMSLKNFARVDAEDTGEVLVDEIVSDSIKMVWNEVKYHVDLEKDLSAPNPVLASSAQLSQVIVNLIMNASQAISDRGNIYVKTWQTEHYTFISIEDNGSGIPEDILTKIFDPFYTTKPIDIGTGLGLSISHGIIEKYGGTIDVKSEVGKGTCFTIQLVNVKTD